MKQKAGSLYAALLLLLATGLLSSCVDSGADATSNPNTGGPGVSGYQGVPQTDLVRRFAIEMWPNLNEKCGNCHVAGGQSPSFAQLDINSAYNEAITVTNLVSPVDSRLVSKVGGGHNCWLPNNAECADVMTRWIENWVGDAGTGGRAITLVAPTNPSKVPGSSKPFPATANTAGTNGSSFANTVYPILTANCSSCHSQTPAANQLPIAPYFAGSDVDAAYEAAKPKMDLDIPANSRFVKRLAPEGHNCWDPNSDPANACTDSAAVMEAAITRFAGGITATTPALGNTVSGAVTLADATVASGGNRYENNLVALYEFKAGSGNTITDVSGAGTAINLTLNGMEGTDYKWLGGYGVEFMTPAARAQDLGGNSTRLHTSITGSGEFSIEAWAIPGNVTQQDANIVGYSGGPTNRNFTLGQDMYNYDYRQLSSTTAANADTLSTPDADEVAQSSLQHVVTTFDPVNGRRIYVNGVLTTAADPSSPGSLSNWDDTYVMVLGNEVDGNSPWKGSLRLVALHDRALTHQQIVQNFEVGVGEKYFLLFGITHINPSIIPTGSFIAFEFSQIDDYGYLFYKPTYVNLTNPNLDTPVITLNFNLSGMRIGVNGKLPTVGQAYSKVNVTVGSDYTAEEGQVISNVGTVIELEKGVNFDEFFLVFDNIAGVSNPYVEPAVTAPTLTDPVPVADVGVRTFDEINASMSTFTGIPVTNAAVALVYSDYKQQLPTVENVDGFLSSHQMAIAQLALTYCDELVKIDKSMAVNDPNRYFAGFDFTQTETTAFNSTAKRDQIVDPLLTAVMNVVVGTPAKNLTSQPGETEIRNMLSATAVQDLDAALSGDSYTSLIELMVSNCNGALTTCNSAARTEEIVKASCAAAAGGAVMLIQ